MILICAGNALPSVTSLATSLLVFTFSFSKLSLCFLALAIFFFPKVISLSEREMEIHSISWHFIAWNLHLFVVISKSSDSFITIRIQMKFNLMTFSITIHIFHSDFFFFFILFYFFLTTDISNEMIGNERRENCLAFISIVWPVGMTKKRMKERKVKIRLNCAQNCVKKKFFLYIPFIRKKNLEWDMYVHKNRKFIAWKKGMFTEKKRGKMLSFFYHFGLKAISFPSSQ